MRPSCTVSFIYFSLRATAHNGFVCPNNALEISLSASASQKKDNNENNSNWNNPHTPTHAPTPGMIVHHFINNLNFLQMHCCLPFSCAVARLLFLVITPLKFQIRLKNIL